MQNNPDPNVAISPPAQRAAPIAPAWHTIALLLFIGLASATSAYSHNLSPLGFRRGPAIGYLSVIFMQWVIVAFIWFGIRRRGLTLRDLIGGTWPRWTTILGAEGIPIFFLFSSALIFV